MTKFSPPYKDNINKAKRVGFEDEAKLLSLDLGYPSTTVDLLVESGAYMRLKTQEGNNYFIGNQPIISTSSGVFSYSTDLVHNLNADRLDGAHLSDILASGIANIFDQELNTYNNVQFNTVTVSGLYVATSDLVQGLNADYLDGYDSSYFMASGTNIFDQDLNTYNDVQFHNVTANYFYPSGLVVNENGADVDTRIEGDTNENLFFIDASTDRVGIGTNAPTAIFTASGIVHFMQPWNTATGYIYFTDGKGYGNAAYLGSNYGKLLLGSAKGVQLTSAAGYETVINDDGANTDTRIEGDTDANLFFVDASADKIGIGTSTPVTKLEIPGYTDNSSAKFGSFELQSYAVNNCWLTDNLYYNGNFKYRSAGAGVTAYFTAGDYRIYTAPAGTAGATATTTARFVVKNLGNVGIGTTGPDKKLEINTGAATDGIRISYNDSNGSAATYADMLLDSSGVLGIQTTGGVVINDSGADIDTRIEGDADTNLFFVDASSDKIGIGTNSPDSKLTVGSDTAGGNVSIYSTLLSELAPDLTTGNWTLGTGWTYGTSPNRIIKSSDGTGAVTPSAATSIVAGTTYKLSITISDWSVGTATYTLGGIPQTTSIIGSGTYVDYITAVNTNKLIITPSSTSRFTISAISIKAFDAASGDVSINGNLIVHSPSQFYGNMQLQRGTAASPSLRVGNSFSNTGWYDNGYGIGFSIAGTSVFSISGDSGFVANAGIGTFKISDGSRYFSLRPDTGNLAAIRQARYSTTASGGLNIYSYALDENPPSTNYSRLNIYGARGETFYIRSQSNGTEALQTLTLDFPTIYTVNGVVINESGADSDTRIEGDTDANLLYIDAGNDRVGIGTNAPGRKLDVNGLTTFRDTAYFQNNIYFENDRTIIGSYGVKTSAQRNIILNYDDANSTYALIIQRDGAEKARFSTSGNLGIGTTAPDKKLEINTGESTDGLRISYNDSDGSAATYADMLLDSSGVLGVQTTGGVIINDSGVDADTRIEGDAAEYMLFVDASEDRIGINCGTPDYTLDVRGRFGAAATITGSGTNYAHPIGGTFVANGESNNSYRTVYVGATFNNSTGYDTSNIASVEVAPAILGSDWVGQITGLESRVYYLSTNSDGGNSIYAIKTGYDINTPSGEITHAMGIKIQIPTISDTVVPGSNWGIYIDDQDCASAENSAIHIAYGDSDNAISFGNAGAAYVSRIYADNSALDLHLDPDPTSGKVILGTGAWYHSATKSLSLGVDTEDSQLYIYQVGADDCVIVNQTGAGGTGSLLNLRYNGTPVAEFNYLGYQTNQIGAIFNESGADSDTRIEGDTDANLIFVDASADMVGIGNGTPSAKLYVYQTAVADAFCVNQAGTGTIAEFRTASKDILMVYTDGVVINEDGEAYYTRIEGDTDANLIFVDASADMVGIGTNFPGSKLYVYNTTAAEDGFIVNNYSSGVVADFRVSGDSKVTINTIGYQTNRLGIIINEDGGDSDTRIEGDSDENLLYVDAGNDRVGIGTASPETKLDIVGETRTGDSSTNYTNFDTTGHQTMVGDARPWRDELGELLGKKRLGTRITEDLAEGTLLFADNCQLADDYVITNVQLNHDKDLTASIYPHLHWFQASEDVPHWVLQYRWQVNGGTKVTDWSTIACSGMATEYTAGTIHQINYSAPITIPSGTTLSDIVQFRVARDTDDDSGLYGGADPLTGNASAIMFDLHFMINSLGSTDEYTK